MRLNCTASFRPVYTPDPAKPWLGTCKQFPALRYWGVSDEAALSGVRRLAKKQPGYLLQTLANNPTNKPPAKSTKQLTNRVCVVLDRSGSMSSISHSVVAAFNSLLIELRNNALATGQKTELSLLTFANDVRVERLNEAVEKTSNLSGYWPSGGTSLLDATGQAIERLRDMKGADDENTSMLVIVITDGYENTSQRFNAASLSVLMQQVIATDRWTIAFQVPHGSANNLARQFGIPRGNITEWEATERGTRAASVMTNSSVGAYYNSRSAGMKSSKDFYVTDLSKVTQGQLKTLVNIKDQVRVLSVEKEQELRPFVEGKTKQPLLKGAAFYQLTKTEKEVQDYKQLLIVEKGPAGSVYAGSSARQLLGLPAFGTVKVAPGNHMNYDVFVQSTSTNRKLVRGTKVVYWPSQGIPYLEGPSSRPVASPRRKR